MINKKILFGIAIVFVGILSMLFSIDTSKIELTTKEKEKFLTIPEQNEQTVKSFLTELMGNDYELLIYLFDSKKLNKSIDEMSEQELKQYAQEIGKKIKGNKTMVRGQVSFVKNINDVYRYTILLSFSDGSQKQIQLDVKNGVIITPIEQLTKP